MNDRTLLELAAKACGELTPSWYGNSDYMDGVLSRWNPLTDDGDALRLSVKIRLDLMMSGDVIGAFDNKEKQHGELREPDQYAATRRAIVRAAASIGEQMK